MNTNPYRVLGLEIPTMLGRNQLCEQLVLQVTKRTPDHVSVVGPRHIGKSVLLKHLATQFIAGQGEYLTAAYWDLRHNTPDSDDGFIRSFVSTIKYALRNTGSDLVDYIDPDGPTIRDDIALVLGELDDQKKRLLVIMDGFDHILARTGISRNTWDALRSFAQKASLRLVTGSRQKLRELCRTEESATSDFWEIFNPNPFAVGSLEDHDWDGFLDPFTLRKISFDGAARKELNNWTGGVPVLSAAMTEMLFDESVNETMLSKTHIDRAGHATFEKHREIIASLWDDCSEDLKSDLAELQQRDIPLSEVPEERRRELTQRGYARVTGNALVRTCSLMGLFAKQQAGRVENLRRLFGDAVRFGTNIQSLLELRLSQITGADPALRSVVQKTIRELAEPEQSIMRVRSIANRALDLIWEKELPRDRTLPTEWINAWNTAELNFSSDHGRLPGRRGAQCNILRLITGTEKTRRMATYVTKPTYLLVDHLQSVGDFGQHPEDRPSIGFVASVCLSAIELCASLARDFTSRDPHT